jgi:hypothetical protein
VNTLGHGRQVEVSSTFGIQHRLYAKPSVSGSLGDGVLKYPYSAERLAVRDVMRSALQI